MSRPNVHQSPKDVTVQSVSADTPLLSRFPHFAFRLAVVITLTGLALYAAIDHATHETICCAPRAIVTIADKASPIWTASIFALIGVLSLVLYVLFRMLVGIATGQRADIRPFFIDCIFGFGAILIRLSVDSL